MRRFALPLRLLFLALLLCCHCKRAQAVNLPDTVRIDLSSAAGIRWELQPENTTGWKPILVPAGGWRAQGYTCDEAIYRAHIPIPDGAKGQVVRLAFAAVNFGAEVFVGKDDAHLTRIAAHINGWMPFTADLTPYVTPGELILVQVTVKGRHKFMVNGKYTVPEGATWDDRLEEGILRGISLEVLPPIHIDDVCVQTRTELHDGVHNGNDTYRSLITITNGSTQPATVRLAATFSSWNHARFAYPKPLDTTVTLTAGETRTLDSGFVPWTAGPNSYWWPNVPYRAGYRAQLHLLDVTLMVNGQAVHRYRQRFGFRQFAISNSFVISPEPALNGAHYELNGVRCNLRGDNQQEADFGTDAYGIRPGFGPPSSGNPGWPQAVDNLLRLNFNVMRIHQIPATPYMLDVCDELGLMLVEESPLRGSEGGEDFEAGREVMKSMDRELVLRDRNHPATVLWSAANEWTTPIPEVIPVILAVDDTRPIIADGVGDFDPKVVNMEHYVNGLGGLPLIGGRARTDRPYGETEAIWPMDNTWQGFAWMATSIRIRRLLGDSDLRNYVLNNAWSNYVPGEGPENEIIEKGVKRMGGNVEIRPALTDPWHHPLIRLMQQCYHPLAVCDIDFDRANARSNANGDWPTVKPRLKAGTLVTRQIAVFNDEFTGEAVTLRWQAHKGGKQGPLIAQGSENLTIPPGHFVRKSILFQCPKTPGDLTLSLSSYKDGKERFHEDALVFQIGQGESNTVRDGVYRLLNLNSGLPAEIHDVTAGSGAPLTQGNSGGKTGQVWRVKNLGNGDITLTNVTTGLNLAVESATSGDGSPAIQQSPNGNPTQIWHLESQPDGTFVLINKATGKLLDVYAQNKDAGARIVQWQRNGGDNQAWRLTPSEPGKQ